MLVVLLVLGPYCLLLIDFQFTFTVVQDDKYNLKNTIHHEHSDREHLVHYRVTFCYTNFKACYNV